MADKQENSRDIGLFKKAIEGMIAKSGNAWNESLNYFYSLRRAKEYTKEEVEQIISSNSLLAQ
jgi:hypothetical protein